MMYRAALLERNVRTLFHFTRLENIPSMLARGICPVANLRNEGVDFLYNDEDRHDGHVAASCFSIGHPNYRMFYKCRQDNPLAKWVVLSVYANVLDEKTCSYFYTNAANRVFRDVNPADLRGVESLRGMYGDIPGHERPADLDQRHTTDPQAEVMIFDTIEPNYIHSILCRNEDEEAVKEASGGKTVFVNEHVFRPRRDHGNWR